MFIVNFHWSRKILEYDDEYGHVSGQAHTFETK